MQCMVLNGPGQTLSLEQRPTPTPGPRQVLLEVSCCAICRTDLHVIDGDLADIPYPIVLGHEIVGRVINCGAQVPGDEQRIAVGSRVGVPWLGYSCGRCEFCKQGQENLCDHALFTGYQIDGGFATHTLVDHRYCFPLPQRLDDQHAAPLLCAGLIGYRSLAMCGDAQRIGIYGFGAAAHIIAQVATHQGREIFAFTRAGDHDSQRFAQRLGARWAGSSDQFPPQALDAAIIFAPVGELVPQALASVRKGGLVVCGGIHMSDIPGFAYSLLWGERQLRSVANLTRTDASQFLQLANEVQIDSNVEIFPLREANQAVAALRGGKINGAAVLDCHMQ